MSGMARMAWWACVVLSGCAHQGAQSLAPETVAEQVRPAQAGRRYVDPELGFEISRPSGGWALDASDEDSLDGVSIPVVMRHKESGAQVVVQVAPGVATPTQFAERLSEGLKAQPGFTASDPEPVAYFDGAVGFDFGMGDKVIGRVAVVEGSSGRVYMMMATWPTGASPALTGNIEDIFNSLRLL